ncbi:MAG: hypothetical protein AAF677_17945 [Pseudomonadota bacterium]
MQTDPEGEEGRSPALSAEVAPPLDVADADTAAPLRAPSPSRPDAVRDEPAADPAGNDETDAGATDTGAGDTEDEAMGSDVPDEAVAPGGENSPYAVPRAPLPQRRPPGIAGGQQGTVVGAAGPGAGSLVPARTGAPAFAGPSTAATAPTAIDGAALIGVMLLDGERQALVRLGEGRYHRVAVGDRVAGWQVMAIDDTSILMGSGSAKRVLGLLE